MLCFPPPTRCRGTRDLTHRLGASRLHYPAVGRNRKGKIQPQQRDKPDSFGPFQFTLGARELFRRGRRSPRGAETLECRKLEELVGIKVPGQ